MLIRLPLLLAVAALAPSVPSASAAPHSNGGARAGQAPKGPTARAGSAVTAARSAIGSPYASGGTTKAGFDCSGLTTWAFRRAGVRLPRTSFDQFRVGRRVRRSAVRAGDLVFFSTAGAGASHVGIAVSRTRAISATSSGGVMEHSTRDSYWGAHYVGARRR